MTKKVAVIGAGIFGSSIAIELSKNIETVLFEKEKEILTRASSNNHFRHHYGYHYPRSPSTALECINGRKSFEKEYGDCIFSFPHFYSVEKEGSLTTPDQYLKFCDDLGLPYKIVSPDPELINPSRVALTIQVPEEGYDPIKLKEICKEKLILSGVNLRLNSEVIHGNVNKNSKRLIIKNGEKEYEENFDYVIEATYANLNKIKKALGIPRDKRQYDLLELLKLKIPHDTFGVINMDGYFSSMMPIAHTGIFLLAHIKESVLERRVSDDFDDNVSSFGKLRTNKEKIMEESIKDFPILKYAEFVGSMYSVKALKPNVSATSERPSEITDHGNGVYSVFQGKIPTAVSISKKIAKMIKSKK